MRPKALESAMEMPTMLESDRWPKTSSTQMPRPPRAPSTCVQHYIAVRQAAAPSQTV